MKINDVYMVVDMHILIRIQLTWKLDRVTESALSSTCTDLNGNTVLTIRFKTSNVGCVLFKEILSHQDYFSVHEVVVGTLWLSDWLVGYLKWSEESSRLILCKGDPIDHSRWSTETLCRCEYGNCWHCKCRNLLMELLSDGLNLFCKSAYRHV